MISNLKSVFFLLCLLLYFVPLQSQNTDSKQTKTDSLSYYANIVTSSESKDDLLIAFDYFSNQRESRQKNKDVNGAVYCLMQLAIIQIELGILHDSEKTAIEALDLIEQAPESDYLNQARVGVYNHLGRVYRALTDFDSALDYYQKAYDLTQNKSYKITIRNNIAYAHYKEKRYDLALDEFNSAYNDAIALGDSINIARSLNNRGTVKGKLGDASALADLEDALAIRLELGDTFHSIGSYIDLVEYYQNTKGLEKANEKAKEAYRLAKLTGRPNAIEESLGVLVSLNNDADVRDYKKITDSIKTANLIFDGKYFAKKYALEKQENIAKENLLIAEQEKSQKLIYGYSALLIFVLGLVIILFLRLKFKKEKQLEVYNTELRISKKVHDEVANDVYHIMTKLQHNDTGDEAVLDDLESVYNKTRDISREYNDLNVDDDYGQLLNDLIIEYNSTKTNVITKNLSNIDWTKIQTNKKIAIYRVLQELLTNMSKHSQASVVVLTFKKDGSKVGIEYTDNGVGCNLKKQNGLQNAENRILASNGSITFKSQIEEGFNAIMRI